MSTSLSLTGKRWNFSSEMDKTPDVYDGIRLLGQRRGLEHAEISIIPWMTTIPTLTHACERLQRALASGEGIGLFGDYDCDGITATALLVRCIRRFGIEPIARLPHRLSEGYGLQSSTVAEFHAAGVTLLITLDTGIGAHREIAEAKRLGMDVIVIDHHRPPVTLPDVVALLHPSFSTQPPASAPCTAGIAFGFISCFAQSCPPPLITGDDPEMDRALAAIGTIADLVPLTGMNRELVKDGLLSLERVTDGPLAILREKTRTGQTPLTARDVAFRIAPRLNAAGRMDDPHIALQGLLGNTESLHELEKLNTERQQDTMRRMDALMAKSAEWEHDACICAADANYSPGIVGLLAGKLTESFGKPSLVASIRDDVCIASLRGIPGYDLVEGLTSCADLLTTFGGHRQAAGCRFPLTHFDDVRQRLNAHVAERVPSGERAPSLTIDLALTAARVTADLCSAVAVLEPFGAGNPEPMFLLSGTTVKHCRRVGTDGAHLQGFVGNVGVIGFRLGHLLGNIQDRHVDLACKIGINEWQGIKKPQLIVEDLRITPAPTSLPS